MMTHDPFQNHQTIGAYLAGVAPFGLPYTAFQPQFNPMAITGHGLANPGIGGYGMYPQQQIPNPGIPIQQGIQQGPLQQLLAWNQLAALQNPMFQNPGFQNPGFQNPVTQYPPAQNAWANPLLTASLQNPLLNPALAYHASQQPQPFTYPLAPQTMIGAGAMGQPFGQINPLAQLAALRQLSGYGVSPVAGYY